jgi:hypothetical protein
MTRIALTAFAALAAGLLAADERKKPTDKEMKERMIAAHRGDASPYAKAEKEATAEKPNWDELAKHLKPLRAMSGDNQAHGPYTAGGYATAVAGLENAVADKDARRAAESFAGLRKSCAACHKYGGALPLSEAELRKERPKK